MLTRDFKEFLELLNKNADGVDFADCYRNRVIVEHDRVIMPIININDLQKNKAASGRPKDLEDLRNLNDTALD